MAAQAPRKRMAYLPSEPDIGSLLRALLRLRHDLVMIGRAAVVPFSETLLRRLELPLGRAFKAAADYFRGSSAAIERRNPPPLDALDTDFDGYEADIAALRREGLTRDLPGDAEQCVREYA
jgi:hypothetical protein